MLLDAGLDLRGGGGSSCCCALSVVIAMLDEYSTRSVFRKGSQMRFRMKIEYVKGLVLHKSPRGQCARIVLCSQDALLAEATSCVSPV